jgi:hypothetical protein
MLKAVVEERYQDAGNCLVSYYFCTLVCNCFFSCYFFIPYELSVFLVLELFFFGMMHDD